MGLVFVMVQSAWTARVNSEPERVCWHVLSPGEGEQPWGYPARIQPSHLQVWSQTDKLRYAIALKSENQIFKFPFPQKNISPLSADNVSYKAWLFLPQLEEVGHKDQLYSTHFPGRQAPAGHSSCCHEGVVWAGVCNSAPSPSPVMLWQGHSILHHPQGCVVAPAHSVWGNKDPPAAGSGKATGCTSPSGLPHLSKQMASFGAVPSPTLLNSSASFCQSVHTYKKYRNSCTRAHHYPREKVLPVRGTHLWSGPHCLEGDVSDYHTLLKVRNGYNVGRCDSWSSCLCSYKLRICSSLWLLEYLASKTHFSGFWFIVFFHFFIFFIFFSLLTQCRNIQVKLYTDSGEIGELNEANGAHVPWDWLRWAGGPEINELIYISWGLNRRAARHYILKVLASKLVMSRGTRPFWPAGGCWRHQQCLGVGIGTRWRSQAEDRQEERKRSHPAHLLSSTWTHFQFSSMPNLYTHTPHSWLCFKPILALSGIMRSVLTPYGLKASG